MPNWCYNILTIHNYSSIQNKIDPYLFNENYELTFKNLVPYLGEWNYDWCIQNWGTKWDADFLNLELGDDFACIRFQTAWSPPVTWFNTLLEKTEADLTLYYEEEGEDFAGKIERKNNIIQNECWSPFDRKIKNNIPKVMQKIMQEKILLFDEEQKMNLTEWIVSTDEISSNIYDYHAEIIIEECEDLIVKIQNQLKVWLTKNKLYKLANFLRMKMVNNQIINVSLLPPDQTNTPVFKQGGALFKEKMRKYLNL